ncbi:Carboxylating nicotinate-nucleotide pyrophosphorylase [Ignavibacterium album JCM 16511]|uniref:Probable nicotinate-nucleotide pyrophosphorylase [carboxylating] n=1 Tax=Ignavibacterium album (strain DSM 19864 / JCM 16511 / NBRC 101810 / Mat9-16) TaxID=945713 RepID=I0AHK4_IGNAJ|nr:carboxylating nicotinate-nucleotide diphosphorylase [Ignavibacterium album]AFH48461.1 Carboxylating nicotinate-nucleotide pyrophosphorylase [Ignavibacterium album JCM 16511]
MKQSEQIKKIIKLALQEDIGKGDITSLATIKKNQKAIGKFLVKDKGLIAGLSIAKQVMKTVDSNLKFKILIDDGSEVKPGDIVAEVSGNARAILSSERTALNFLQRMSGIATASNLYAKAVAHTKAKVIDTRKTAPGLRMIDKMAVKIGGCENHRLGLYDMFLIKDNHIEVAGSITKAVDECRKFMQKKKKKFLIEVETKNPDEVLEALKCKVDIIMLDNFKIDEMKKAVELINGRCKVEASGGVNLSTIKSIAETGVDYISVGGLTHSVKALDISLEITPL